MAVKIKKRTITVTLKPKTKIYNEYKAEEFLKKYLPITQHLLTKNLDEGLKFCSQYKYPIALKVISDQALHKTEIKGVRVAYSDEDVKREYDSLMKLSKKLKLKLDGILFQKYRIGREIIIGGKKDKVFGQTILFGSGGIYTEFIKDVSIRICPITEKDALEMIDETHASQMLGKFRGDDPVDKKLLVNALMKLNKILLENPDILELDINPLIINKDGIFVVDARMLLE